MSIEAVVQFVVDLLVIGVIFGILFWLADYVSTKFPRVAPFADVAKVVLVIFACLVLIGLLLSFLGYPVLVFPRHSVIR